MTVAGDQRAAVPPSHTCAARGPCEDPGTEPGLAGIVPGPARAAGRPPSAARRLAPGFRPLRVDEVRARERDVVSISLSRAGGDGAAAGLPGQFLTVACARSGGRCLRSFAVGRAGQRYRISVKREPTARSAATCTPGSRRAMCWTWARRGASPGDGRGARWCLLISAGVGATPVLAMLQRCHKAASARCGGCTAPGTAPSTPSVPKSPRAP